MTPGAPVQELIVAPCSVYRVYCSQPSYSFIAMGVHPLPHARQGESHLTDSNAATCTTPGGWVGQLTATARHVTAAQCAVCRSASLGHRVTGLLTVTPLTILGTFIHVCMYAALNSLWRQSCKHAGLRRELIVAPCSVYRVYCSQPSLSLALNSNYQPTCKTADIPRL